MNAKRNTADNLPSLLPLRAAAKARAVMIRPDERFLQPLHCGRPTTSRV